MGQLRSAFRAVLLQTGSPAQTLGAMNGFAELIPGARCTTVLCATVDERTGMVRYATAGHLPGIAVHADGSNELLDGSRSVPLAVLPTAEFPEATIHLRAGSTLLLYSDGLVERRGERLTTGITRALRVARDARDHPVDQLVDQVLSATLPSDGHEDDVVVLAYRLPDPAPLRLSLVADTHELAPMRARLNEWLARAGASDSAADRIVLAATEACSNAVEHGYEFDGSKAISVLARLSEGRVEVEVRDAGCWRRPMVGPTFRGRGRTIMEALMDELAIDASERGTTVRMVKELRDAG
jgi:anti-sigma regulatory factor (Ser/Thr protein kinase)